MRSDRKRHAEMVESIVRQRDMYRVLLQHGGSTSASDLWDVMGGVCFSCMLSLLFTLMCNDVFSSVYICVRMLDRTCDISCMGRGPRFEIW